MCVQDFDIRCIPLFWHKINKILNYLLLCRVLRPNRTCRLWRGCPLPTPRNLWCDLSDDEGENPLEQVLIFLFGDGV